MNPAALDVEEELRRFTFKVEAGAEFAITQPIFDVDGFRTFLSRMRPQGFPVIAGLMPLASLRHAEFMANEVPGIHVPDRILERMRGAESAGRAAEEGLAIARDVAAEIRPLVRGVQISTAPRALDMALALVEAVGA